VVLQLLSWIVKYHALLSDSETNLLPILNLSYCGIIRLLIRIYLCNCVWTFLKTESNPSPTIGGNDGVENQSNGTSTTAGASSSSGIISRCLGPLEPSTSALVSSLIPMSRDESNLKEEEEWNELLPVGQGAVKFCQYYYKDVRKITKLLVTIDLVSRRY
jgi:hypothetical protein